MDSLQWCDHMLISEKNQKKLKEKIRVLTADRFSRNEEYEIEKFIKSYCEPIMYLEIKEMKRRGISPSQMPHSVFKISHERILNYFSEVEKIVSSEIEKDEFQRIAVDEIILRNKRNQFSLRQKIENLLLMLRTAEDSLKNEIIYKYYNTVKNLEDSLYITFDSKHGDSLIGTSFKEEKDIEQQVESEIKRQLRHHMTYMYSTKKQFTNCSPSFRSASPD